MNANIFLDIEEIQQLTDRVRSPAQLRVLKALGIEHKVRPDGSIVILRAHIAKVFDGNEATTSRRTKQAEPNWEAI